MKKLLLVMLSAGSIFAQTTNTLPKFTGSGTAVTDSSIVDVNGNIGLGTSSPVSKMHLSGSTDQILTLQSTSTGDPGIQLWNSSGRYTSQLDGTSGTLYWKNSDGIRLLGLSQNGKLGIGTSSPDSRLTVYDWGGKEPIGGVSVDIGTFGNSANSSNSYYFRARDIGAGGTAFLIKGDGNVGIGTGTPAAKLDVVGSVRISGSGASMTFPDGSIQSTAWNGTTCGGDYAESVDVAGDRKTYEPGDVLVIDPEHEGGFLKSSEAYATGVTGVFSTKPGLTGRRQLTAKSDEEVPMAMVGIVPTKVSAENGAIKPGDLLVSSSKPGYAMKGTDRSKMLGAVIGKALGHLDKGTGLIEVVILMQ